MDIKEFGNKLSDKMAKFGGSWTFLIFFVCFLWIWVLFFNSFDPYPFILLNLILSTIAAFQAPVILMTSNRQEEKDRKRDIDHFQMSKRAEEKANLALESLVRIEDALVDVFKVLHK